MFEKNEPFDLKLTPKLRMKHEGDYGIYACESTHPDIILNPVFKTFVIVGDMQKLTVGKEYSATVTYQKTKRGDSYYVHHIKTELPTTIEGRQQFLKTILSEHQANLLITHFPPTEDIIKMIREDKIDYKKIKGMGEHTYNSIKGKIEENIDIQEALTELSVFGISFTVIKNLIKQMRMTPSLIVEKIKENPYILCDVKGLGYQKVDDYALKMGIEINSIFRIEAAIHYVLKQIEIDGNCWMHRNEFLKMVTELTKVDSYYISQLIENQKISKIYTTKDVIARQYIYDIEMNLALKLKKLMDAPVFNYEQILSDSQIKIEEAEKEQGFKFNKEQLKAINYAIKYNIVLISGKAGTGKTATIKGIMKVLQGLSYSASALSGKAAQRIEESTGLHSSTLHRLLGATPNGQFVYNEHNLLPFIINIGDESSMNNSILQYQFIRAIDEGKKVVMVGDIGQLPAIGVGSPFSDMITSGVLPTVELTEVHRQAEESGILSTANAFREGIQVIPNNLSEPMALGKLKDLLMVPKQTTEEIMEYVYEICQQANEKFEMFDFQVITPLKNRGQLSCKNLNPVLQTIFNSTDKEFINRNGYDYREGDKIIKNGNDYDSNVFNGTMGKIIDINLQEEYESVKFEDKIVNYSKSDLDEIEMAYALTGHKMQGAETPNVLCILDYSAYKLLNKQWVYTALTRASKKCIFVFQPKALKYALSQDHVKRNTFLKNFLIKVFNENEKEKED